MSARRWIHTRFAGVVALVVALVLAIVAVVAHDPQPDSFREQFGLRHAVVDPEGRMTAIVTALRPVDPYTAPTSHERELAHRGIETLLESPVRAESPIPEFTELGYALVTGVDPATDRPVAMLSTTPGAAKAWGSLFVDLSSPVRLAVEVPHPNSDLRTEQLAIQLFRRIPGVVVLVAGAHRAAGGGTADAAHFTDSLFHIMSVQFARRGIPQLQLHGFADRNLQGADVVVSSGAAATAPAARRLADRLQGVGFATCRAWETRCGLLEGTTNIQGQAAEQLRAVFIHLEVSWTVRRDKARQADLVFAVSSADVATRPVS